MSQVRQFDVAVTPLGVVLPVFASLGGGARLPVTLGTGTSPPDTADDVAAVAAAKMTMGPQV
jgi:hypothetical protein